MLVTIILLATIAFDEPPPSRFIDERPAVLEVAELYFRTRNLTLLEVDLGSMRVAEAGILQIDVDALYTGKGRGGPRVAALHLTIRSGKAPRYRDDHAVTLTVDGRPITLKADHYAVDDTPGRVSEKINVRLVDDRWPNRLETAQVVEISVGADTFQFRPRQVAALKAFGQYVSDPKLAVKRPRPAPSYGPESPDRAAIPSGQAVLWREGKPGSCDVTRKLAALDAAFGAFATAAPERRLEVLREIKTAQLDSGDRISVPYGTHVRILERRERSDVQSIPDVAQIEILDGLHKGFTGWCDQSFLVTSLQTADDRAAAEAEALWGIAEQVKRRGDRKLAIETYREVVKLLPGKPRAEDAAKRIESLMAK